jgi:hypothetical protein
LREKPTGVFLAGLAAALAGVAMLVKTSLEFSPTGFLGDALGVVTAMFYAGYILAVKGLRDRGETVLRLMAITSTLTAVILFPVHSPREQMLPQTYGWTIPFGLALISTQPARASSPTPSPTCSATFSPGRPSPSARNRGLLRLGVPSRTPLFHFRLRAAWWVLVGTAPSRGEAPA